jgi:multisubunit Na+/H+ antiporter MnhB subunit
VVLLTTADLGFDLYVAFATAFLLFTFKKGNEGVKRLLRKGFDTRIRKTWYIPAFLL